MGLLRAVVRDRIPLSGAGLAFWSWRHRHEIGGWVGYAARSAPRLVAERDAVLAEGRLRARLTADKRTRNVDGLRVDVVDGIATLSGLVPPEAHDAAVAIATNTTGITRVRDELREPARRRRWASA